MGLLNADYYTRAPATATLPAPASPPPVPPPSQPAGGASASQAPPPDPLNNISPAEQIRRYGGLVGSPEYLNFQAKRGVASYLPKAAMEAAGLNLPDQQTWDTMTVPAKSAAIGKASLDAAIHLITSAPAEIAKAPVRISNTLMAGAGALADKVSGKQGSLYELATKQRVPVVGVVPNYFNTYDDARKSGLGPLGAAIVTGNQAFGDLTVTATMSNDLMSAFRPRARTVAGTPIMDVTPIQKLVDGTKKAESTSEYYSMPKTVAKKYGGNDGNTFFKLTPSSADGGGTEVSVVQRREGVLQKAVDRIKGRGEQVYQGDFGPELKLKSEVIPTDRSVAVERPPGVLPSIPEKPLKGFANKPITPDQISNLDMISRAAGADEKLANSIMRSVTGKSAVGELTQAEYVDTARALGGLERANRVEPGKVVVNPVSQYLSPQRHFTRSIESRGGPPIYTDGYVRVEDAFQNRRVFLDSVDQRLNEMYGKYSAPKFAEERRLVREATEGRTDAIQANDTLTPETKSELMDIVAKRRAFYDEYGKLFGIDKEHFLANYSPRIQDIGGVYQLYKEGTDVPKEFSPFFEKKRKGALHVQVDDALALDQIYARAGANKLYVNPALKGVNDLIDSLEPTLRGSMRSYVQEKLGYAGRTEQYLDEAVPKLMAKLGIKAPADVGRQAAQFAMNTTYSGALGFRLGSAVRNAFQAFNSYIRQGPEFFGEAVAKAATKEGVEELRRRGLTVKLGVPSGADLAQESSVLGQAKSRYTRFTQASLIGQETSDAFSRATTFWQGKYQWDDAFAKYKAGQLNYDGLESKLDFNALDPADRNIIRKDLIAGDADKAFNHYIREVIDETQFPFRRGASFRAGYGLAGKAGFQFAQWPIEQAHMLGRWLSTGQYDKLIRWHATATALTRAMNETFGVDIKDSYGIRTVVPGAAPLVKFAQDAYGAFTQFADGNQEEFEKHKDGLARTLISLGVPAGVQIKAFTDFKKSFKAGPVGPNGTYPVYGASGKLTRYATFRELWQKLWGFNPAEASKDFELGQSMRNAQFFQIDAKQQALQLMQQSLQDDGTFDTSSQKYKDAMKMIQDNSIQIGPSDFKAYYIPANERTFSQLPRPLQAQFAPRVFPQQ